MDWRMKDKIMMAGSLVLCYGYASSLRPFEMPRSLILTLINRAIECTGRPINLGAFAVNELFIRIVKMIYFLKSFNLYSLRSYRSV